MVQLLGAPRYLRVRLAIAAPLLGALLIQGCGGGGGDGTVPATLNLVSDLSFEGRAAPAEGPANGGTTGVVEALANAPPVANAGTDRSVATGTRVTLSGTGSSDADGDALRFSWRILSKPCGSAATLAGATSAGPRFTADRDGRYVVRLIVNDGTASSVADRVVVNASGIGAGLPPPAQQAYLKPCNTALADRFGLVAVSGNTLVVGAPYKNAHAGVVYVFTRRAGVWTQQAALKASNAASGGDEFGSSISLSGDTLAVGAPAEDSRAKGVNGNQVDNSANGSGAVYVFTRTNGVWSQQAYLKASNTEAIDMFGTSVAVSGDTLAVGATGEDGDATGSNGNQVNNRSSGSGAVYVFTRENGVWRQQAYIKASNPDANDRFGTSVALSGGTLAVGAIGEASSANGVNGDQTANNAPVSGAVYVFTRMAGVWRQQAYLKASNTVVNGYMRVAQWFGISIALSADTLAVGSPLESSGARGVNGNQANQDAPISGAAYVFTRTNGVWGQQAYVKASNTGGEDGFGYSVALSGDRLAVGAFFEDSRATGVGGNQADNSATDSGAVYVFKRTSGVWRQRSYVKASNTAAGDAFGGVALHGTTLVVGAGNEDSNALGVNGNQTNNSAADSGAAYVFVLP